MTDRGIERALFIRRPDQSEPAEGRYDRIYYGHESCHWRLSKKEVLKARQGAEERGMAFTLVTPHLDRIGLDRMMGIISDLSAEGDFEVVANDPGLVATLHRAGWEKPVVLGRLLTRQRRVAHWNSPLPEEEEALRYLRGSALDSPGLADWFGNCYGIRRFEVDNLIQGTEIGPLPDDARVSVYHPYLLLTVTRHCPWRFDGQTWDDSSGCPMPCREGALELGPVEGGRRVLMEGKGQFVVNTESDEIYSGPIVDRHVFTLKG